ncbi:MAG: hypothetical protein Q7O66_04130, partial [Dehalococcoidia bacterium]|nr:hypothetical protein [Dehalococcoidia bacterium]
PVRYCGIAALCLNASKMVLFGCIVFWPSEWIYYVAAALAGFATAAFIPVQEVIWAAYFGRISLGAIRSISMPFTIVFSAGATILAGWVYDTFGSYQVAFVLLAICFSIGAVLVYFTHPPRKTVALTLPDRAAAEG